jgi:hypothetical protein
MFLGLIAAIGAAMVLAPTSYGQDKDGKGKNFTDKKTAQTLAASVNFGKELGVDIIALGSLGARIDSARDKSDPVILAALALELAAAESASGKTASIKSADITKEAVDLAKQRYSSAEIKAVAQLAGAQGKDLAPLAAKAATAEAKALKDREEGVKPRGIKQMHVDSRSTGPIAIYVNGYFRGIIPARGDGYFYIGDAPWETTVIRAVWSNGYWVRREVPNAVDTYTWTLTD